MIRTIINGFFMALADSVPGVSGGTIALIMGFYDNFIGSINKVIYGKMQEKKEGIIYLAKLFIGWAVGMIAAILALTSFFEKNIYAVSSLFLGFIIPSIFIIAKEEWQVIKGKWKYIPFFVIGLAIVLLLSFFANNNVVTSLNLADFSIKSAAYLFIVGALAITAMFLPGISGSTVLLIFGVYVPVISGVKELLGLNFRVLPMIIVFGVGILFGALLSVKGIQDSLIKFRGQTVLMIIGMLIGSLWSIISGPKTVSASNDLLNASNFSIIFFILGIILIALLQLFKIKLSKKSE